MNFKQIKLPPSEIESLEPMNFKQIKLPHTLVIIFLFMSLMAILTWIIPGGRYQRQVNSQGREVVVRDSFEFIESRAQGIFALLKAPITGISQTAEIIGFILIIGGVFAIIQQTKVIHLAIFWLAKKLQGREKIVIPVGMVLFGIFGAVFGMSEEVIPFIPIFIPLALAIGYDSIVGVCIPFLGAGLGFAGALLNPFTIGVAQGIAELPLFSGLIYRGISWLVIMLVGILLVMRYATRIKRNPAASPVYELDQARIQAEKTEPTEAVKFNIRHRLIVLFSIAAILIMIWGVMRYQWFIREIAAIFLGLGIVVGVTAQLSVNTIARSLVKGAEELVGAALVVGFARAILVLASDGQIIDTIMYRLSGLIATFHPVVAAQLMFILQTCVNFFVPSGSGQAALTMPIMAPLADLVGVTRQTAVLAFQMGDGFTNMIIPTSGVTMGVLGMAKIPWQTWARWLINIELFLFLLGLILLIPPVLLGWGPF